MNTQLAAQTPIQACDEDRICVKIVGLPEHFPANIRKALRYQSIYALSEDAVQKYAPGQRMGPDNFLIPKGHIISLIHDVCPDEEDLSFLDKEPEYIFFCQTCCQRL